MIFKPLQCKDYFFHMLSSREDYDYLWYNMDSTMHRHTDFYELFFLAGGTATHYYRGEEQQLHKKWMFFLKPGEFHQLHTEVYKSFHFSFFAKESYIERFFDEHPVIKEAFSKKNYMAYEMTDTEFEFIYSLANSLIHQGNEEHKISLLLYSAISLMMMNSDTCQEVNNQGISRNNYVIDLISKINNYSYLTCKVRDIYKNYPIARTTLIREFKEYTGMTIVQYQRKHKLIYASQLLINSNYTITEIAELLKFESLSHFLRIFKEQYGITPKEYRKVHMR